ncbi:MAG: HD domain-containing protein [Elusimicrobiota bacterium]
MLDTLRTHPVIRLIEEEAGRLGRPVYMVGGLLRDALLRTPDKKPFDFDIAVDGPAKRFAGSLAKRLGATSFVLHEATQIHRIALKAKGALAAQIDVAALQGRTIEEDLGRRDFTLNAIACRLPLASGGLIDPHNGRRDLQQKILRATSPQVFPDDSIRMLRAFRIAAALGLTIDQPTLAAIKKHRAGISRCAGERIHMELMGVLSAPDAAVWIARMDETRLLTAVFPELEAARTCAKVYYGAGGVLKHTLEVMARMDFLLSHLDEVFPDLAAPIRAQTATLFDDGRRHGALLRLAALVHDVAKPECAEQIEGRLRFFEHEARGAQRADGILRRLRFSAKEREMTLALIRHHLRPGNLAANQAISDKAVFRFFRDLGDFGVSLLLLCWADHASYLDAATLKKNLARARKPPRANAARGRLSADAQKTIYHLQVVTYLLDRFITRPDVTRPKRLLSGKDIMRHFKLEEGPKVGEILKALDEAQAEGRVRSRAEALRFVRFNFL